MRSARMLLAPLVLALVMTGCAGSTHSARDRVGVAPGHDRTASSVGPTRRFADWPTYHRDARRSGHVSAALPRRLEHAWTRHLDGAVYGEPLVVGGLLVVATERDVVYGLNPRTGHVRWHVHLGRPVQLSALPCGDIDPLGITGTPAYDEHTGSVFVAAETTGGRHTLWAINAATGHRRWHRSLDTQTHRNRMAEQQRSALLVTHGRVITTFGGLAGDCANYVGYATSVAVTGKGAVHSYAVPTPREAGMWAPPGPVRGSNGNVYVAAGNGARTAGRWDRSDSVTELSPVRLHRVSAFAPSSWQDDNARDLDLGSSSPVPVSHRIVIAGKRGTAYLLRPSLGGVGSAVDSLRGCTAFGGAAVAGPHSVLMPCLGENRIRMLHVTRHHLRWGWTASGLYASPVVAGPRVYVADRDSGDLVVLRLSDGHRIQRLHAGELTHFPSATISGGMVFVPTLGGVAAFRGR